MCVVRLAVLTILILPASLHSSTRRQEAYIKASNTDTNDQFGQAVAIDGSTIIIGAGLEASRATGINGDQLDNSEPQAGAAYVFVRNGTNWMQQAYLKPFNTLRYNRFGVSVAISGDTAVVGAEGESSNAVGVNGVGTNGTTTIRGAAYVFVRDGTNWTQQAYLKASDPLDSDYFGKAVAISGDTVIVGAFQHHLPVGAAYVFVRTGTNWAQQSLLQPTNTGGLPAYFGWSVAVSGDVAVVGAWQKDSQSGSAYIYRRTGTNWVEELYIPSPGAGMWFGFSVAAWDNTVVVGAPAPSLIGAAYVYGYTGANWLLRDQLAAANAEVRDEFGRAVRISDSAIVVGARGEDSMSSGIDGIQDDNSLPNSGAAYLFVRTATNWAQCSYLKASNPGAGDQFGSALDMSGDTIVVGAFAEDSSAVGINGNQGDSSVTNSGAAYVFTGFNVRPHLSIAPDLLGGYYIQADAIDGFAYELHRSEDPGGPWTTNMVSFANGSGVVLFHDTNAPPRGAFYRVMQE